MCYLQRAILLTKALIKINNNNNNGCSEVCHVAYLDKPYLSKLDSTAVNNPLKIEYEIIPKRQLFTEDMDDVSEKLINNISFYKSCNIKVYYNYKTLINSSE